MIALAPMIDRLEAAGFKKVQGVVEFAGLTAAPAHSPALFVISDRESAEPNRMSGIHDQRVVEVVRIVVVIKPTMRADGKPSEELKAVIDRVIAALVGWQHPGASRPFDYAGGRLLSADGRAIAWGIDVTTSWHLRKGTS